MALGFQDCCNLSSYFYLTGIPASVQQNEIFLIQTLQGETFCAKYVTVPSVNYSIPTYTLVTMTEKTSCNNCTSANSCPTETQLLLSEFGSGTVATSTDCYIKTFFPMVVSCVATPPTVFGGTDGKLALYVVGGIPPYAFYNSTTFPNSGPVSSNFSVGTNQYAIYNNIGVGNYPITATDSETNFFINVNCFVEEPPEPQTVTCTSSPTSYENAWSNNGSVTLTINGGVPPFTITRGNTQLTTTQQNGIYVDSNLGDGTYTYTVTSSSSTSEQGNSFPAITVTLNCQVTYVSQIVYPTHLCFSFQLCGENFSITYYQNGSLNNRPKYTITTASKTKLGLNADSNITYNSTQGWVTNSVMSNPIFENTTNCLNGSLLYQFSSTPISGQISPDDVPQDYIWTGAAGITSQQTITFSPQICQVTAGLNLATSDLVACSSSESWSLTFNFFAYGGVGPYQYKYRKTLSNADILTSNDIVTLNQGSFLSGVPGGNWQVIAVDTGNGNIESAPYVFTVNEVCTYTNLGQLEGIICVDDPSNNSYTAEITVTTRDGSPNGQQLSGIWVPNSVVVFYKKGNNSYTQHTGGNPLIIYGNVTNAPQAAVSAGNYGAGTYTIYTQSVEGASISQELILASQTCSPPPIITVSPSDVSFCAGGNGTVTIRLLSESFGPYQLIVNGNPVAGVSLPANFSPYNYQISQTGTYNISILSSTGVASEIFTVNATTEANTITFTFEDMVQVNPPSYESQNWGSIGEIHSYFPDNIIQATIPPQLSGKAVNFSMINQSYFLWEYFWELDYQVQGVSVDNPLEGYFEVEILITDYYTPLYPTWVSFSGAKLRQDYYGQTVLQSLQPVFGVEQLENQTFAQTATGGQLLFNCINIATVNEFLITGHLGVNTEMSLNNHGGFYLPNNTEILANSIPNKYDFNTIIGGFSLPISAYMTDIVIGNNPDNNNPYRKWWISDVENNFDYQWATPPLTIFNGNRPPALSTDGLNENNFIDLYIFEEVIPLLIENTSTPAPTQTQVNNGGWNGTNGNYVVVCVQS